MKKVILLGAMLLLAFTSCSKSDENKEEIIEPQEVARYYVKYEVTYNDDIPIEENHKLSAMIHKHIR